MRNAIKTLDGPIWITDRELATHYGVSRMTIWRWAGCGVIPRPRKLGPNTSRWSAHEIEQHDQQKLAGKKAS